MWRSRCLCFWHFIHWVLFWYFPKSKWNFIRTFVFLSLCLISFVNYLITVLFINWDLLLKRCFTWVKTILWDLIGCADGESVGLHMQMSTVKHPYPLIAVNSNSVKSKSTIVHVRICRSFIFDAVDLFKSQVSNHKLVLSIFYWTIFMYNIYCGVVEMMNVNKGRFVIVMWILVTCTETIVKAAGFTVLIYICGCSTFHITHYTIVLF